MLELSSLSAPVLLSIGASGILFGTAAAVFGVRKLIRVGQFSYHNSRLSTAGNPYVRREEVLPMLDAGSPQAISKSISTDLLSDEDIGSFREADSSLTTNFHSSMDSLLNGSPGSARPLVKANMARLEVEELKRLIRLVGVREDPLFPVGWLTADLERNLLSGKDIRTTLEVLEGQPVSSRLTDLLQGEGEPDLMEVDTALDRFALDSLRSTKGLPYGGRKGAGHFLDILADRYNLHLILRSKKKGMDRERVISMLYTSAGTIGRPIMEQMVDAHSVREALSSVSGTHIERFLKEADQNDLTSLENALDRMILEGSIGLSHSFASSVGPTIRYMVSKEMELKNLRVLFQSAFSGWDPDRTRRLLVMEEAR